MTAVALTPPPRQTGNLENDQLMFLEWMWKFYTALNLETDLKSTLDGINTNLAVLAARLDRIEATIAAVHLLGPLTRSDVTSIRNKVNDIIAVTELRELQLYIDALNVRDGP